MSVFICQADRCYIDKIGLWMWFLQWQLFFGELFACIYAIADELE